MVSISVDKEILVKTSVCLRTNASQKSPGQLQSIAFVAIHSKTKEVKLTIKKTFKTM
jgi:hypothetical protein